MEKEINSLDLEDILINLEEVRDLTKLASEEIDCVPQKFDLQNNEHQLAATGYAMRAGISRTLIYTALKLLKDNIDALNELIY